MRAEDWLGLVLGFRTLRSRACQREGGAAVRPRRGCQFAPDSPPSRERAVPAQPPSSQTRRELEASIVRHRTSAGIHRGQGESCPSPPHHPAHRLRNRLDARPVPATTPRLATNATSLRRHCFIASFAKSSSPWSSARDQWARRSHASSCERSAPISSAASWLKAFCASTVTRVATIASSPSLARDAVFCPSCGGRRMAGTAAHLVDCILPEVPIRQWVLTLPYPLRYRCA